MGRSAGRNAGLRVPGQVEAPGLLGDSDAAPRMAALCPYPQVEAILRRYVHYGACTASCPTTSRPATSWGGPRVSA